MPGNQIGVHPEFKTLPLFSALFTKYIKSDLENKGHTIANPHRHLQTFQKKLEYGDAATFSAPLSEKQGGV